MSKKKSKKSKKKHRKRQRPATATSRPMMDPRAMEKMMLDLDRLLSEHEFTSPDEANTYLQQLIASGQPIPSASPRTPIEQAQDLMYQAFKASGKRKVELARQALQISADCADAYVFLAEETAGSLEEAKDLYEQGVKAGERALGLEMFAENVGHFWGIIETRPYMRARAGLAQCLWMLGERQQAIEHYTAMLRLNPNDNQGIRYMLITCLLEEGLDEAAEKLLKQYEGDGSACWLYSHALWMFRKEGGASKKTISRLKEALVQNPLVPFYLLGMKRLPRNLPDYIGFGDENEAIEYVVNAIEAWQKTEGALEWLLEYLLVDETEATEE